MKLDLLRGDGNLVENAAAQLLAACVFPNDPISQRQALLIYEDERDRFFRAGGLPHYRASNLVQRIISSTDGEAGQRAVAGYTTIALALLKSRKPEKPIKLYGAASVVQRALANARKLDQKPLKTAHLKNGVWEVQGQRCPSTRGGIETAWRSFGGVSHVIAADAILAEWFPLTSIFERPPEHTIALLKTASIFQPHVAEAATIERETEIEVAEVAHLFERRNQKISPMPLGNAVVEFLSSGLN